MVRWLALLSHSKKVLGSIYYICAGFVCAEFACFCMGSLSHSPKTCTGDSKLPIGTNANELE